MSKNYRAEITGVFGDPVDDNPTGVIEEAAYAACGLNYRYLTLKVTKDDFDAAMASIRALHMKGMNLTMPHKINVLPYLDELSEAARIIGAVNTIVVRDDKLFGENTDGKGFVQALKNEGISLEAKKIVILGAGGAARAIAVECGLAGAASITIVNRTFVRAEELAEVVRNNTAASTSAIAWEGTYRVPEDTDIFINATSIGLMPYPDEKPDVDYATITDQMVVSDVVFNPAETLFLKEAAACGAKTVSGLGMLACQGALNFTLWTGVTAPLALMEETLRKEFSES
ncbi:MAG: shikimate dehydrogenase [Eubacteriales bacterium]|nr:shikimate dehydrogenase [Eubacteriales bacterium]